MLPRLLTLVPAQPDLEWLSRLATFFYDEVLQNHFSVAGWWRDPFQLGEYFSDCKFLPYLNNEISPNATYKQNILGLNTMLLVMSDNDGEACSERCSVRTSRAAHCFCFAVHNTPAVPCAAVFFPPESSWFQYFANNSDSTVVPLANTPQFHDDLIGLRTLNETGRLQFASSSCPHDDFSSACFQEELVKWVVPVLSG